MKVEYKVLIFTVVLLASLVIYILFFMAGKKETSHLLDIGDTYFTGVEPAGNEFLEGV